ncbi:hypothetical protein AGMMS50256_17490 [Betaproteobacteria bacterium]|nr:hypothetical protein AGMMS50256_17490 [Betaproteobacteria bacterium]
MKIDYRTIIVINPRSLGSNTPRVLLRGGDEIPPGTFRGGDEIPPGTFR